MDKLGRIRGLMVVVALATLCVMLAPSGRTQEGCDADVEADLKYTHEGSDVDMYEFQVEVTVNEDCAQVHYDLVIEELLPNGQTKKVRKARFAKLNDGSFNEVVEHKMSADLEMLGFEAKIVSCEICTIMP
ncbi:MAG: hypothetical protein R3344_05410 [Acidobacteriota bacterium]|nr:hypothetical protein [Acidobacteriota bacterium]